MTSIRTNIAAYYAQANLKTAGSGAQLTIGRLSSGQKIIKASDDVAGLSLGTILRSNVNTLKTALGNTQQASSLLQVADGGLKNIGEILQRQKALAVQANSGTLSGSERGFLNQEFQNLVSEIDRLVDNTKFNQVKLLDGSLSKAVSVNFNTLDGGAAAGAGATLQINAAGTAGQYVEVNGVRVYLAANGTAIGDEDAKGKVIIGANATETGARLAAFLNASTDSRINVAKYTAAGGTVSAVNAGGTALANVTFSFGAGTTTATATNTNGLRSNGNDGLSVQRVYAVGDVNGDLLYSLTGGNLTDSSIQSVGIDIDQIEDNADFIGKIGGFTATYTGTANTVVISVKVGDITYTSAAVDAGTATAVDSFNLTGSNGTGAEGGTLTLGFTGAVTTAIDSQGEADDFAARINSALSSVTFLQNRDVTSFVGDDYVYVNGVKTGTLVGTEVDFVSDDFSSFQVEDISVTAPGFGSTDAVIEMTVNGETYRTFSGLGSQIQENSQIILGNVNDSKKTIVITTGTDTIPGGYAWKIDETAEADALETALLNAFGVTSGRSKIEFQTGQTASDKIGVEIESASTTQLYEGKSLDILTAENAIDAGAQIDVAIGIVTSLRADIGALQSRFDYAAANLDTSIQNQDAARALFLDADISDEASKFASFQVLLQASISVLAQANLLPQNLLKLIG